MLEHALPLRFLTLLALQIRLHALKYRRSTLMTVCAIRSYDKSSASCWRRLPSATVRKLSKCSCFFNLVIHLIYFFSQTEWETCQATSEQCLLDYTNTSNPAAFSPPQVCAQGSVPSYYVGSLLFSTLSDCKQVELNTAADVQAVFAFAKTSEVDIVIKNTGVSTTILI